MAIIVSDQPKKLIQAVKNECQTADLWAEICTLNKNRPAPLDEKTMYTLQSLHTLMREKKILVDFYSELKDEVPFRDQLELDSMDFLDIVMELRKLHRIRIPEEDYNELASMHSTVTYLTPLMKDLQRA